MVENGRNMRPRIERREKKCFLYVNEIENEIHFITQCPLYAHERKKLYGVCLENAANFEQIPTNLQKYIYILSNGTDDVKHTLANYVYNSLKIRESVV